jgi:CheY-like chemotaxis protein
VERKNKEVEQARQALEEKAKQLALTSKYKSEFLANMSHELRTPLNSLLILSDQLSKNPEGNLSGRQVEFAKTIHSSGNDLLTLINDILDLSKIESGTTIVDVSEISFRDLHDYVDRTFRHVAENKRIGYDIDVAAQVPRAMYTDAKRLQQILKNLLSNAFKFTDRGAVTLRVEGAKSGWNPENERLNAAKTVIAFSVTDTGSASRRRSSRSSSRRSSRRTARRAASTAARAWGSRSAARSPGCWAGDPADQHAGRGEHVHALPTADVRPPPSSRARGRCRRRTCRPPPKRPRPTPTRKRCRRRQPTCPPTWSADRSTRPRRSSARSPTTVPTIADGDRVLLVVENDTNFARMLMEIGHEQGFKVVVATRGAAALKRAREVRPERDHARHQPPDIDGGASSTG